MTQDAKEAAERTDLVERRKAALMRGERALRYPTLQDEDAILTFEECRAMLPLPSFQPDPPEEPRSMTDTMEWKTIDSAPDGRVVMTKIDDANGCRNEQRLKRSGNLWFVPDGSMYVYYRPTHWKPSPPP